MKEVKNSHGMTRYQMFVELFEPQGGWANEDDTREAYLVFERGLTAGHATIDEIVRQVREAECDEQHMKDMDHEERVKRGEIPLRCGCCYSSTPYVNMCDDAASGIDAWHNGYTS